MIPYFATPVLALGPVSLDSWRVLVAAGIAAGLAAARARGVARGLEARDVVQCALFVAAMGLAGGHAADVLVFHRGTIQERGWAHLFEVWAGLSSAGGFIGATLGAVVFCKLIRKRPFWALADAVMFGFPAGWTVARLGCFTAHDHVGGPTRFFLAVDFPEGARHDLGLYEALWTAVIAAVFFALRRRPARDGFFVALFIVMYAPVRFGLDFLRITGLDSGEVRWGSLTPAQYLMLLLGAVGACVAGWLRRR